MNLSTYQLSIAGMLIVIMLSPAQSDERPDVVDQPQGEYETRLKPVFHYSDEKDWYHPFTNDPLNKVDRVDLVAVQRKKAPCTDGYVQKGDKCYSTDCGLCGLGAGHQRACGYEHNYDNGYVRTYHDCCIGVIYVNSSAEDPITMCTTTKLEKPNRGGCGISMHPDMDASHVGPNIVGGNTAALGEFPWQISLRVGGRHNCGGTLLSEKFVLTASHCVERYRSSDLSVAAGQYSIANDDPGEQFSDVSSFAMHPNYTRSHSFFSDIAMIKLETPLQFSDTVTPACLPEDHHDAYVNQEAIISGWGRLSNSGRSPDKLQYAKINIVSLQDCFRFDQSQDTFCVSDGVGDTTRAPCYGDSGGPMVVKEHGRWVNIGVTSYVRGGCAYGYYSAYKSVPYHLTWIHEMMARM